MNNKQKKNYIKQSIENLEREMVSCEVQAWVFQKEVDNPIHITVESAKSSLETYKERIQYLKENIDAYNLFIEQML